VDTLRARNVWDESTAMEWASAAKLGKTTAGRVFAIMGGKGAETPKPPGGQDLQGTLGLRRERRADVQWTAGVGALSGGLPDTSRHANGAGGAMCGRAAGVHPEGSRRDSSVFAIAHKYTRSSCNMGATATREEAEGMGRAVPRSCMPIIPSVIQATGIGRILGLGASRSTSRTLGASGFQCKVDDSCGRPHDGCKQQT